MLKKSQQSDLALKNFDHIGCKLQTAVICREGSDNNDDGDGHEDHDGDSDGDHDVDDSDDNHDVDDRVQSANGGYLRRKVRCSSRVSQKLIPTLYLASPGVSFREYRFKYKFKKTQIQMKIQNQINL